MTKFSRLFKNMRSGFTMIELLVVIAVIGVLAVAVLSSINPIEQINKGRDTRTRSDAAQLLNAVDRYFSIQESYPWNDVTTDWPSPASSEYDSEFVHNYNSDWGWAAVLVEVQEVKEGFYNRLVNDATSNPKAIVVFKAEGANETMYACFKPASNQFKREAMINCDDAARVTPDGVGGITTCATTDGTTVSEDNYICLP